MEKKTVIVTGASSGLGKAMAAHFIQQGWNVVMNSSDQSNLEQAYTALGAPSSVALYAGNIGIKENAFRLIQTALEHFGKVDALINNAGIFAPKPFLEVEENELEAFLQTNLKGTFFASQAVIRHMKERKEGAIINIGTVLVDHAIGGFPASAPVSSKGGIHALTRQLAAEFAPDNIKVNLIAPGVIRSPLQAKIGVEESDSLGGLHLLNRIGESEEIVKAADFLIQADFVTGEVLNVDGGHVAGHVFQ